METSAGDRDLVEVMKRYFAVKAEVEEVKLRLEAARRESGEEIDNFYNPRTNQNHAADIACSQAGDGAADGVGRGLGAAKPHAKRGLTAGAARLRSRNRIVSPIRFQFARRCPGFL
jgi:hypothetical protein